LYFGFESCKPDRGYVSLAGTDTILKMERILIETGDIRLSAELNESETAKAIYDLLPLTGSAIIWGEEIYFSIPLHLEQSRDARMEVRVGELGFWPAGDAFCIFFGPTPVSQNDQPMAYSPVNVFGSIQGDPGVLRKVVSGDAIRVSREEIKS
jgi:hypothetical protein